MDGKEIIAIILILAAISIFIKLFRVIAFFVFAAAIAIGYFYFFDRDKIDIPKLFGIDKPSLSNPTINNVQNVLPDLTVGILWTPESKIPYQCHKPLPVVCMVNNNGTKVANNIEVSLNGNLYVQYIQSLMPNSGKKVYFNIELNRIVSGTGLKRFDFYFMVDPKNRIIESNEFNNRSDVFFIQCF